MHIFIHQRTQNPKREARVYINISLSFQNTELYKNQKPVIIPPRTLKAQVSYKKILSQLRRLNRGRRLFLGTFWFLIWISSLSLVLPFPFLQWSHVSLENRCIRSLKTLMFFDTHLIKKNQIRKPLNQLLRSEFLSLLQQAQARYMRPELAKSFEDLVRNKKRLKLFSHGDWCFMELKAATDFFNGNITHCL